MVPLSILYGSVLVVLGGWAAFTTSRLLASRGGRKRHRVLIAAGVAFVASCLLPGTALLAGRFEPWMLTPIGLCYLALIPLPCYFKWANHGRIGVARTVLFALVGAAFLAAGTGWLPLAWFGL